MSDDLMTSLRLAIAKLKTKNTKEYTPVRQSLKKYKGNLLVFNEETHEFNYY